MFERASSLCGKTTSAETGNAGKLLLKWCCVDDWEQTMRRDSDSVSGRCAVPADMTASQSQSACDGSQQPVSQCQQPTWCDREFPMPADTEYLMSASGTDVQWKTAKV